MRTSLVLLVAVIVVLVTALVILTLFGGGVSGINEWIMGLLGQNTCESQCNAYQYICTENKPYAEFPGCDDSGVCKCVQGKGGG